MTCEGRWSNARRKRRFGTGVSFERKLGVKRGGLTG